MTLLKDRLLLVCFINILAPLNLAVLAWRGSARISLQSRTGVYYLDDGVEEPVIECRDFALSDSRGAAEGPRHHNLLSCRLLWGRLGRTAPC